MISSKTLAQIDYIRWVLDLAWEYEEEMLIEETIIRAVDLAYRFYRLPTNIRSDLERLMTEAQEVMEDAERRFVQMVIDPTKEDNEEQEDTNA